MPGNETLLKIAEAEAQAEEIRNGAAEAARKTVADAQREAEDRLDKAVRSLAEEKKNALENIRSKAENIMNENRKDAVFEAERLKNRAIRYEEDAVRYICMEIGKKCQS